MPSDRAGLVRTAADGCVMLGIVLVVVGVACAMAGRLAALPILAVGSVAFAGGSVWTVRRGSSVRPWEHVVVLAFTVLPLVGILSRAWSWQFAFVGDEWVFFWTVQGMLHGTANVNLLGRRDTADLFTNLSFAFPAWTMQLAGEDVFGWRLSSVLPFVLSVPGIYVIARWLAGPAAAVLAAGLFASSHVLQTFTLVAYNNTQAFVPFALGLGLFAWATARPAMLRYLLLGMVRAWRSSCMDWPCWRSCRSASCCWPGLAAAQAQRAGPGAWRVPARWPSARRCCLT